MIVLQLGGKVMKRKSELWGKLIISWIIVIVLLFIIPAVIPKSLPVAGKLVIQNTIMLIATYLLGKYLLKIRPKFFSGKRFLSQIIVVLPVLLYLAVMVFGTMVNLSKSQGNVASIVLSSAILGLFAALFEELYFRVVMQTTIFRSYTGSQAIYMSVIVTSVLFSLSHLIVNYSPGDASGVLMQTVSTFGSGLYMGALFLRTRNIIWPLLLHGVNDFTSIAASGGSIVPTSSTGGGGILVQLLTTVVFILVALFILRKSKHAEILDQFSENAG